jgi:hypothetical protein
MINLFALTLWYPAFAASLFVLASEVWQDVPFGVGRLVGATLLGMIGPLGTWDIARHYPETDWLAWRLMITTGGTVAIMALLRLMVLLGA